MNIKVAELRLQAVVKEQLYAHLKSLPKPTTESAQQQQNADIESMIDASKGIPDEVWGSIRPAVLEAMFTDFKYLYNNFRENSDFVGLIDAGNAVVLTAAELQKAGILPSAEAAPTSDSRHAFFPREGDNSADAEEDMEVYSYCSSNSSDS